MVQYYGSGHNYVYTDDCQYVCKAGHEDRFIWETANKIIC